MDKSDTAISVKNVYKTFKLPHEKQSSIKGALVNFGRSRKGYEKQEVLTRVNFEVKKGEFFGIVGRNGSGKSTLLKLLAGIYTPTKGSINVTGRLTPFIELGVGFNPELTGRANVYLNGALLGFSRKEMREMYHDIVKFAEMERFMDQKLKNYSSGMQVRLAFSIAIRADTDILLIDEVLAVGDQSFQEKCFRYFYDVKKSDKTVIFVTHDMSNVERFCDRVLVLDKRREKAEVFEVQEAVSYYNELNHPKPESEEEQKGKNTSDIYIESVDLLDHHKHKEDRYKQGDPMTVRIRVGHKKMIPDQTKITLGLSIHDLDNTNLAGPNSRGLNLRLADKAYDFNIKSLPFNMGEYRFTVALFDEQVAIQYDLVNDGPKFFINTDEVRYGKFVLDAEWSTG